MQNLPSASVYEKEFKFMPWGKLVGGVVEHLSAHVKKNGEILDLMCGTGYLLGQLNQRRPDLSCIGVDIDPGFIAHAASKYKRSLFQCADVLAWKSSRKFDAVICTAGIHHLEDAHQEKCIAAISELVRKGGFAIIADPYIEDYATEQERILNGARLGYKYLVFTIESGGTPDVIDAAVQVLRNDVLLLEWKTSIDKRWAMLERHFKRIVRCNKTWPDLPGDYGDYYFVVKN